MSKVKENLCPCAHCIPTLPSHITFQFHSLVVSLSDIFGLCRTVFSCHTCPIFWYFKGLNRSSNYGKWNYRKSIVFISKMSSVWKTHSCLLQITLTQLTTNRRLSYRNSGRCHHTTALVLKKTPSAIAWVWSRNHRNEISLSSWKKTG